MGRMAASGRNIARPELRDQVPGHVAMIEQHDGQSRRHHAEDGKNLRTEALAAVLPIQSSKRNASVFSASST